MDFGFRRMNENSFSLYGSEGRFNKIEFMSTHLKKDEYELTSLNKIKEDITYF